ncbi:hypothetical protein ACQUJT_22340 [Ralstonia pseudosolanacearum]
MGMKSGSPWNSFDHLVGDTNQYAAFFKAPTFSTEREWRLVTSYKNMKFRSAAARLVPYAEFGLVAGDAPRLELLSLTVSPTADPELAKEATEGLLVGYGLRNFAIDLSAVPRLVGT